MVVREHQRVSQVGAALRGGGEGDLPTWTLGADGVLRFLLNCVFCARQSESECCRFTGLPSSVQQRRASQAHIS